MRTTQRMFQKTFLLFVLLLVTGMGFASKAHAQGTPVSPFGVFCSNRELHINVEDWTPGVPLTLFVNGEEAGKMVTSDDGAAHFTGRGGGLLEITLEDADGNTLVAGRADCTVPPPEIARFDVDPSNANVFLDVPFTFRAFGVDENDEEMPVYVIWTTESGSISPDGVLTVSQPGEFIVTVTMAGDGYSSTYLINVTATAPPQSLKIFPEDITLSVGDPVVFGVTGVDAEGNEFPITPKFDIDGGEIDPFGFYAASEEGDFTVTATIEGIDLEATAVVHVIPVVESIEIRPQIKEIEVESTQQFEVVGIGEDGEDVPLPAAPMWSAELGEITEDGLYTATTEGIEIIEVVVPRQTFSQREGGIGVLAGMRKPFEARLGFQVMPAERLSEIVDEETDQDDVSATPQGMSDEETDQDDVSTAPQAASDEEKTELREIVTFIIENRVLCCSGSGLLAMFALGIYLYKSRKRAMQEMVDENL